MHPKISVSALVFSDKTRISVEKNDMVVIVGPNNSGKSATLREISTRARQKSEKGKVLIDIDFASEGEEDILAFLDLLSVKTYQGNPEPTYNGFGFSIYGGSVRHQWQNANNGLGSLHALFVTLLNTESRLSASNPPQNINLISQPVQHPIHLLQKDDSLEKKLSEHFRQAFEADVIVHRNAGNSVPLYVGEKPSLEAGEDRISATYLAKLERLDLLHEQGDGMRSFMGVLLHSFVAYSSILLIDEPEAFLHPPQARLLGRMLAKELPKGKQLFISTHSDDFLKGILDSDANNIKIIRLQREGNINRTSVLHHAELKEIWKDPLLRHSNILSGLFHSKVIVCESDSDCRFYSAILSASHDDGPLSAPDVLFTHCGGKHRLPTVVKALKKLNVDVRVVADFDILNDKNPLSEVVNELGGEWSKIEQNWRTVKTEIEKKRPELLTEELKKEILEIVNPIQDRIFPKEAAKKIEAALKKSSAWTEAKNSGKAYIPSGNATASFSAMQQELTKVGLHILEVGELECFAKSIGNHGPKWVNEVLTRDLKNDPELEAARTFVSLLIKNPIASPSLTDVKLTPGDGHSSP